MNEIYANAYQEVIEVLKYTKKEDLIKIPKFKIDMYKKYMNKNNGFKIDKTKSLEEQDISNEAKAILANLYKDYWATDYEKQRIEAKENYDLEQIAKEKYSTDNLFKKREVKAEAISHNENSMIIAKKEKWYKKIFNSIKKFFSKKNNEKLSLEEITQIEKQKSDGDSYARMFDKEYSKMTKEEKEETDKIMNELDEIIGFDDDINEKNNTYSQISYEEYKRIFEKDKDGCFINLIITKDEQNEELNLIGKKPSDFSKDEIVRMKKYSEQLYKKVDKNTINEYNISINNDFIGIDEKNLKEYAPIIVDEEIDVDFERACDILEESCKICNISEISQVKRLAKISPNNEGEAIEITDNTGEKYYIGIGAYGFIEIIRKHSIDGKIIFVPIED